MSPTAGKLSVCRTHETKSHLAVRRHETRSHIAACLTIAACHHETRRKSYRTRDQIEVISQHVSRSFHVMARPEVISQRVSRDHRSHIASRDQNRLGTLSPDRSYQGNPLLLLTIRINDTTLGIAQTLQLCLGSAIQATTQTSNICLGSAIRATTQTSNIYLCHVPLRETVASALVDTHFCRNRVWST